MSLYRPLCIEYGMPVPTEQTWVQSAIFYHIYPLGFCGAPQWNDRHSPPVSRLNHIYSWADHIQHLGVNALYLGPIFESAKHGYDTIDYQQVDRRLGTNRDLTELISFFHTRGVRVVLDGVFNHVGRDFPPFLDLRKHGKKSKYRQWFSGLRFDRRSPAGDPFWYSGWKGHYDLVKLKLSHPEVREYLFKTVEKWIREFDIDGLRLDAADCMDIQFLKDFSAHCKRLKSDFWLKGEIVQGDYSTLANAQTLDSVTNYESYHALHTSHNRGDYTQLSRALERQFGQQGAYQGLHLYSFADNHDVDRVASILKNERHILPLYTLLFTMPGIPSIYYGSEWGWKGRKGKYSDGELRPFLKLEDMPHHGPYPELMKYLPHLSHIRKHTPVLQTGSYQTLLASKKQLVFLRKTKEDTAIVAVNASGRSCRLDLTLEHNGVLLDLLNHGDAFPIQNGQFELPLAPYGSRILRLV